MHTFEDSARAMEMIARIDAVPTLFKVMCEMTGLRFAAVVRVTGRDWKVLATRDELGLVSMHGKHVMGPEDLGLEDRFKAPLIIERLSAELPDRTSPTPAFETLISVPVMLSGGRFFGSLCAFDTQAVELRDPRLSSMFEEFAALIASQLEQRLAQEIQKTALLDERAASELREQFIAILGHDLRNPLQAIYASSDLLQRQLVETGQAQIAARIKTNARRMASLIDDVLDFARGRLGGGIGLEVTEVDNINTGLETVIQELRDAQPERRILADINVSRAVRCDLGRLQQVASNLLGNALTHGTSDSPIEITASNDESDFVLEVRNDGEPIPEQSIQKIFEPFWRHSVSASRNGLGLGLHICAQIVRAHQGEIGVTSTRAKGTTFTVRLPLGLGGRTAGVALHTAASNLPIPTSRQIRG